MATIITLELRIRGAVGENLKRFEPDLLFVLLSTVLLMSRDVIVQ